MSAKIVLIGILFVAMAIVAFTPSPQKATLNMANTVSPILTKLGETACGYENVQFGSVDGWAKAAKLIYKRESTIGINPHTSCIDEIGNVYYFRCYDWKWKGDDLYYRPTRDIPLNCYSCIDEEKLEIPYYDEQLQKAEIGVEFLVGRK